MNFFKELGRMFRQVGEDFTNCFKPLPRRKIERKVISFKPKSWQDDAKAIKGDWDKVMGDLKKAEDKVKKNN